VPIDPGVEVTLEGCQHEAVMQWKLTRSGPMDGSPHIQVGTLTGGEWYVRHMGFGSRRFRDKQSAWQGVQSLMARHQGEWVQTTPGDEPFLAVCRADGSRVVYDAIGDDECLVGCWGDKRDKLWDQYFKAVHSGPALRRTEAHELRGGSIEMTRYADPADGSERYAVVDALNGDCRIVDYPDRQAAEAAYEEAVYENMDDESPYKSCDIEDVRIDRRSKSPEGITVLPSGEIVATDDLEFYNEIYGLPLRTKWPKTTDLSVPVGTVSPMTTEPRSWGPQAVDAVDVTPATWDSHDDELRPNDLALTALPDGRQLLASAHDGGAYVWNTGDGKSVRAFSGHSGRVLSVATTVLSDGKVVLATGGKDGLARLWSARDGDALQEIDAHEGPVNSVAWACPPGVTPWLVTGGDDATVQIWEAETQLRLTTLKVGKPSVHLVWSVAAAVLSDGHVCVVAGADDMDAAAIHVWDPMARTKLHEFRIEVSGMSCLPKVAVATLADRSFRVAAIAGSVVRVWDGLSGRELRTLTAPDGYAGDVGLAVMPDLRVAVAATRGPRTVVWDVESGAELAAVTHGESSVVDLVSRPDDTLLLTTGGKDDHPARLQKLTVRR
jgi:WD40 repeat protein